MNDGARTAAAIQGELWSARAPDWSELQESQHGPKYEDAMQRIGISGSHTVLDLGCGAGTFCRVAADAGASVTGLDAAPALVELARERVPEGRFDVGDMQSLPYGNSEFDRVTAFNSLQFVPDPSAVLAEMRRVSHPGGRIYILVWGREEHTDLVAVMKSLHPLVPPRPSGSPGPFALSSPGFLESLVSGSGLTPNDTGYIDAPYEYPDQTTMLRAICSSAPAVLAARTAGETKVQAVVAAALEPYRTPSGRYRLQTEYRFLTAYNPR